MHIHVSLKIAIVLALFLRESTPANGLGDDAAKSHDPTKRMTSLNYDSRQPLRVTQFYRDNSPVKVILLFRPLHPLSRTWSFRQRDIFCMKILDTSLRKDLRPEQCRSVGEWQLRTSCSETFRPVPLFRLIWSKTVGDGKKLIEGDLHWQCRRNRSHERKCAFRNQKRV